MIFEALQHREGSLGRAIRARPRTACRRLARETGITQEQAGELIETIGTGLNSSLREAHFLKEQGE
ncbi:hypothetical protein ACVOMV_31860 [Mesorhizobium atlanticum]